MKYTFNWDEYAKLVRESVSEGVVLLRNEQNTLPVKKNEVISVFGRIQFDYYKSGTGSGGMVNTPYVVSILDGLKNCAEIRINEELLGIYEKWVQEHPFDKGVGWAMEPWCQQEMDLTSEVVLQAEKKSDLALVIIGRSAGEDKDSSYTKGSYLLTDEEENMLSLVCSSFKRVAVLLNVGSIMDMKWVDQYRPQSVLYVWQGGVEGGNGIADVLTGKVSPSGKLANTIAYEIKDYPSTANFGGKIENKYKEDIYVGYRYFETIHQEQVMYPFGYGLSYTRFVNEVVEFNVVQQTFIQFQIKMKVKNIGEVAGKESLQVYYCPPQGKMAKPLRNLIRFQKSKCLQKGESQELYVECSMKEMASYDDFGATGNKSCYVLEPGNYEIYIGTNVREARLVGSATLNQLVVTEVLEEACAPVKSFERLRLTVNKDKVNESFEMVPVRRVNLAERIEKNRPKDLLFTDDLGYRLEEVYDKKISMEQFLSQLTNQDLIHLSRGEGMCSPKVTPGIAAAYGGITERLKQFHIPAGGCADGPSGIRMDCKTMAFALPNGTLLACTFNTELVEKLYEMEGMELRMNKIDTLLGPGMNIHRNPLNGRNFEYFSEDPYLTGAMAVAELKGMHKYGVTGTLKHFACNNQETERLSADSVVSERALREIYLKAFEMCVKEAGAYSIMSTYGPLNGIWTGGNYDLLTTILRKEWGFDGIVMTDWWAKINEEGEDGYRENTTPMIRAQNDVYMVNNDALTNSNHDNAEEGLASDKINRGELARNAANICRSLMKSAVMDRFLKREEDEWEEINRPTKDDGNLFILEAASIDQKEEIHLNTKGIHTDAGDTVQYTITIPEKGPYKLIFRVRSSLGDLAQINMSISLNNTMIHTIAMSSTKGEWVEKEIDFSVYVAVENYLHLYFGQSGMEIGEIRLKKIDNNKFTF